MDAKITRLKQIYACFVDRPLDGALVVATDDVSTFFLVQAIQELDERSHEDIAFSFVDVFESAGQLADALVAGLVREQAALRALAPAGRDEHALHEALIAPLPAACMDPLDPVKRLEALFHAVHARIPGPERRVTWCICPPEIRDRDAYRAMSAALLKIPRPPGFRLVLRDHVDQPLIVPATIDDGDESIITTSFSISAQEMKAETARKAADPRQPLAIRLPALLQLAVDDLGAGRIAAAEEKYAAIVGHAGAGQEALAALSWHGLGEIAEGRGDLTRARALHERALVHVQKVNAAPLRYTIVSTLGRVSAALDDHAGAEPCFVCAAALGYAMGVREASADALERLGDVRLVQGKIGEARDAWLAAADLRREDGDAGHERQVREKIEALARTPPSARRDHGY